MQLKFTQLDSLHHLELKLTVSQKIQNVGKSACLRLFAYKMLLLNAINYIFSVNDHVHLYYGITTISLIFMPVILACLLELVSCCRKRGKINWEFLLHLPLLQLFKHFKFLKLLNQRVSEEQTWDKIAKKIIPKIKDMDLENARILRKQAMQQRILEHVELSTIKIKLVMSLWEKNQSQAQYFHGTREKLSDKLKRIIDEKRKDNAKEMAKLQGDIAMFKLVDGLGESAPQFILQLSILIYEHISER